MLEVALAFVLLVGSGLMVRSFVALQRAQPGYDPNGVLTFLIPNLPIPDDQARQAFVRDLRGRLEALPGVTGVTAANPLPLDLRDGLARYGTEEALVDATKFGQATVHFVQPGYFDVMGTRTVEGRTFTEADNRAEMHEVVVDRVLAAKLFPGQSALGRTVLLRVRTPEPERFTVIGVVEHQRNASLARDGREALFLPEGLVGFGAANRWAVRTSGDPSALSAAVRAAVAARESARRRHRRPADARVCRARAGADEVRARVDRRLCRYCARPGGRRSLQRAVHHRPAAPGGDWRADGLRRRARPNLPHDGVRRG